MNNIVERMKVTQSDSSFSKSTIIGLVLLGRALIGIPIAVVTYLYFFKEITLPSPTPSLMDVGPLRDIVVENKAVASESLSTIRAPSTSTATLPSEEPVIPSI